MTELVVRFAAILDKEDIVGKKELFCCVLGQNLCELVALLLELGFGNMLTERGEYKVDPSNCRSNLDLAVKLCIPFAIG